VLVVDNASSDGSAQAVREGFPAARVLESPENLGGAGGFRLGMERARACHPDARYLWLLDDDAVMEPDALCALLDVMTRRSEIGICGSRIVEIEDPTRVIEVGGTLDWRTGRTRPHRPGAHTPPDTVFPVDYVAACSLLARSRVVDEIGGFDADFFVYWDDVEWCTRARARGYEVVAVYGSRVRHPSWASRDADASAIWRGYYHQRNALHFFRHHRTAWGSPVLLLRVAARCAWTSLRTAAMARVGLSDAAALALEDFLAGRMGRRDLSHGAVDLAACLDERSPGICVFTLAPEQSEGAARFAASAASQRPGLRVAMLQAESAGRVSVMDRLRLLFALLRRPHDVLAIPASSSRMGLHWGFVARVDFENARVVAVERAAWTQLPRRALRALGQLLRVLPLLGPGSRTGSRSG
jgi:GT2 family glycosyltransferase